MVQFLLGNKLIRPDYKPSLLSDKEYMYQNLEMEMEIKLVISYIHTEIEVDKRHV